jgi:dihydrofolate reductase
MRKIIVEIAVSLDGFIEGPNGELNWLSFEDGTVYPNDFLSGFDTIFYGRKAYERFGVPRSEDPSLPQDERAFNRKVNHMRKYVFSRTMKHVAGNGMMINENIEAEINRIRSEVGKNIWLCGGAEIIRMFIRLDLIDEYVLSVHPVILGSGTPLFGSGNRRIKLKLLHSEALRSGVVNMRYLSAARRTR